MENTNQVNTSTLEDVHQAIELIKTVELRAAMLRENREHKKGWARRDELRYGLQIIELNLRVIYETLQGVPQVLQQEQKTRSEAKNE
jgi:hypothetical protein